MLNRLKFLLALFVLCSGFSVTANANEVLNESNTSTVIIECALDLPIIPPDDLKFVGPFEMKVTRVTPPSFVYAQVGEDCAVELARSGHYGWNIELLDGINNSNYFFQGPTHDEATSVGNIVTLGGLAYTLKKN